MDVAPTTEDSLARASVALTVLAVITALATGTTVALLGFVFPPLRDAPPRAPVPGVVEELVRLPAVATALEAAALVVALVAVVLVLRGAPARADQIRCALLVGGPVLLLVGARLLPQVATPCRVGELPEVCAADGGTGLLETVHPFWAALFVWLPLGLLHVWSLRRWWPEAVPAWLTGGDRTFAPTAGADARPPARRRPSPRSR